MYIPHHLDDSEAVTTKNGRAAKKCRSCMRVSSKKAAAKITAAEAAELRIMNNELGDDDFLNFVKNKIKVVADVTKNNMFPQKCLVRPRIMAWSDFQEPSSRNHILKALSDV